MQKRILPHAVAILIFALITIVYFLPLYKGMTLGSHDITQWKAMSKEIKDWQEKTGEQALWTNGMFGGMPAFQISVLYPGNWVSYIPQFFQLFFPDVSAYLFLMFAGFYVLMLCLGVNNWLALGGSLAYGLASFTLISLEAGHNTKVLAMSLMAPAIGGVVLAYRGKILTGGNELKLHGRCANGYFIEPTVIEGLHYECRTQQEEIFGPVLCTQLFDDHSLDEIASLGNQTHYGLSASIWTKDLRVAHQLVRRLKAGNVRVNAAAALDFAMPFGGYKQSGWGRENGREGVEAYTELKSVAIDLN